MTIDARNFNIFHQYKVVQLFLKMCTLNILHFTISFKDIISFRDTTLPISFRKIPLKFRLQSIRACISGFMYMIYIYIMVVAVASYIYKLLYSTCI